MFGAIVQAHYVPQAFKTWECHIITRPVPCSFSRRLWTPAILALSIISLTYRCGSNEDAWNEQNEHQDYCYHMHASNVVIPVVTTNGSAHLSDPEYMTKRIKENTIIITCQLTMRKALMPGKAGFSLPNVPSKSSHPRTPSTTNPLMMIAVKPAAKTVSPTAINCW